MNIFFPQGPWLWDNWGCGLSTGSLGIPDGKGQVAHCTEEPTLLQGPSTGYWLPPQRAPWSSGIDWPPCIRMVYLGVHHWTRSYLERGSCQPQLCIPWHSILAHNGHWINADWVNKSLSIFRHNIQNFPPENLSCPWKNPAKFYPKKSSLSLYQSESPNPKSWESPDWTMACFGAKWRSHLFLL